MNLSRRSALSGGVALALTGCATPLRQSRAPLALADITVMKELTRDYAGTLKAVAAMGFSHFGFRLASYGPSAAELPARDKAAMVRDAGMGIGVVRFGMRGAAMDAQIADAAAIGAKVIALSAAPPFIAGRSLGQTTRAAFDAWVHEAAVLGAKCREAGLTFAYHNHWWDHVALDGETPLDILARLIPPSDLAFELDLAWCWLGGAAPLAVLDKLGARVVSLHLKDVDRRRGKAMNQQLTVIGTGEMDYAALLPAVRRRTGVLAAVEVDAPDDGLAAAAAGARFYRQVIR